MCVAIPARIVTLGSPESHSAVVDVEGVRRDINISLLFDPNDPVKEGEWVLLHVGFALSRIDAEEAERSSSSSVCSDRSMTKKSIHCA